MSEYAVSFTLKQVEVSADTPAEAVTRAAEKVAGDLTGNVTAVGVAKLDRIKVTGLNGK